MLEDRGASLNDPGVRGGISVTPSIWGYKQRYTDQKGIRYD